ncbi:MAG: rhodanese-like domain-containing protein [Deltaproteobacteria bacterium]|nr:rhodanese-like domain-containing protein [Deltaproteobacteria bacterium]
MSDEKISQAVPDTAVLTSLGFFTIPAHEAHRNLSAFHVVDVRTHEEYHGPLGNIPGSILKPVAELAHEMGNLPKDKPLLLVCRSSHRSSMAAQVLVSSGFPNVVVMEGGMSHWNTLGLPTSNRTGHGADRTGTRDALFSLLQRLAV